jgi:hypothetical protein
MIALIHLEQLVQYYDMFLVVIKIHSAVFSSLSFNVFFGCNLKS